jgi:class 3 adenylate cyclase
MTTIRRLAAILAADIAGYSRLMSADEEGTIAAFRDNLSGFPEVLGNGPLAWEEQRLKWGGGNSGRASGAAPLQTTREDAPAVVPPVAGPDRRVVSACRHLRRYAR